jgi:hypothetical protein
LSLQAFLRESTWGYPIIGAIHVLGLAWFGGTILLSDFTPELRTLRRAGLALLLASGLVLFWLQPARYSGSLFFRLKMLLLLLLPFIGRRPAVAVLFWIAVIAASRGIAFR